MSRRVPLFTARGRDRFFSRRFGRSMLVYLPLQVRDAIRQHGNFPAPNRNSLYSQRPTQTS